MTRETEQDNLCYCILTLQYVKRHYVAGYLLVIIIITIIYAITHLCVSNDNNDGVCS